MFVLGFLFAFCFLRATSVAFGISQARSRMELPLLASSTATAMPDLQQICDLISSSLPLSRGQELNPHPHGY